MRILFFTHYFPPEVNAPATRTYENCKRWVEQGHDVTVITCTPNCPDGIAFPGYKNKRIQKEEVDGITVYRVWTYLAANQGTIKRIANYVSYMFSATLSGLFHKPDLIIATSPQFFCGWAGLLVSKFKGTPFLLEIRDLWPDSISAVGAIKQNWIIKGLEKLEEWMYRGADKIVTVGEGYQRELLQKGVPSDKISIVHNGIDPTDFYPRASDLDLKKSLGLQGKFVCSFVGTIGMACGLQVIIESAKQLQKMGHHDVHFLLVGDGASRAQLESEVQQKKLTNVTFLGRRKRQEIPGLLAISDACLIHLKDHALFRTVLPSKLFEAAAMARPLIMGVAGEASKIVENADAGICIEPENAQQLTQAILTLKSNPKQAQKWGSNGSSYVRKHFNREILAQNYLQLIQRTVEK